jgi:hypothetical protein
MIIRFAWGYTCKSWTKLVAFAQSSLVSNVHLRTIAKYFAAVYFWYFQRAEGHQNQNKMYVFLQSCSQTELLLAQRLC